MMMDIFANSQKPFYRFANIVLMPKISKADWIPFIINKFAETGKSISDSYAERVCELTQCHSWYLQQFCFFLWNETNQEVDEQVFSTSLRRLIDTNKPMFMSDVEKLTPSQREMLRAILAGEERLTSDDVRHRYHLGNPNTIMRNKRVLQEKSFVEEEGGRLVIADPVFALWYRQN